MPVNDLSRRIRASTDLSTWAGTGRVVRLAMYPLAERENAFAAVQLRAELAASPSRRVMHHLRVEGGRHEVDLVIDLGRGRAFGIEVKAGAAPTRDDARHLIWLRDQLGAQFVGGVVLHSGRAVAELDDRIAAVPLSALWTDPAGIAAPTAVG